MALINSIVLMASVANSTSNAVLISILATLGFTMFSAVISSIYKKNFVEPVLLGKVINYYLKDSPSWMNIFLGGLAHFIVGYLFVEIHLWLYQVFTPVWYNALFFGLVNGVFGAVVWYFTIKIYRKVLTVQISQYLVQLIIGHVVFALIVLYMYAPPSFSNFN